MLFGDCIVGIGVERGCQAALCEAGILTNAGIRGVASLGVDEGLFFPGQAVGFDHRDNVLTLAMGRYKSCSSGLGEDGPSHWT